MAGETSAQADSTKKTFPTVEIPLDKIDILADARLHSLDDLEGLTQDMGKNGQLQEIIVVPQGDRYEVIAGVGRVLAARKLSWILIKAQLREGLSEADKAHITFSENENRENADPFYQAHQMERMLHAEGCGQNDLASKRHIAASTISRYMSIAQLKADLGEKLPAGNFSIRQLREILRLKTPEDKLKALTLNEDGSFFFPRFLVVEVSPGYWHYAVPQVSRRENLLTQSLPSQPAACSDSLAAGGEGHDPSFMSALSSSVPAGPSHRECSKDL